MMYCYYLFVVTITSHNSQNSNLSRFKLGPKRCVWVRAAGDDGFLHIHTYIFYIMMRGGASAFGTFEKCHVLLLLLYKFVAVPRPRPGPVLGANETFMYLPVL